MINSNVDIGFSIFTWMISPLNHFNQSLVHQEYALRKRMCSTSKEYRQCTDSFLCIVSTMGGGGFSVRRLTDKLFYFICKPYKHPLLRFIWYLPYASRYPPYASRYPLTMVIISPQFSQFTECPHCNQGAELWDP